MLAKPLLISGMVAILAAGLPLRRAVAADALPTVAPASASTLPAVDADAASLCAAAEHADKPWATALVGGALLLGGAALIAGSYRAGQEAARADAADDFSILGYFAGGVAMVGGAFAARETLGSWREAGAQWRACTSDELARLQHTRLYNRWHKHAAGFGSIGLYNALGLDVFVHPNVLLELSVGREYVGSWDLPGPGKQTRGVSGLAGKTRALVFLGQSLYASGGLAYRSFEAQSGDRSYSLRRSDSGLNVSVGNRWHWTHWFLGVDWLSLYLPAVTLARSEQPPIANAGEGLAAQAAMSARERWGYGFLTLTAGAAF